MNTQDEQNTNTNTEKDAATQEFDRWIVEMAKLYGQVLQEQVDDPEEMEAETWFFPFSIRQGIRIEWAWAKGYCGMNCDNCSQKPQEEEEEEEEEEEDFEPPEE